MTSSVFLTLRRLEAFTRDVFVGATSHNLFIQRFIRTNKKAIKASNKRLFFTPYP